VAAPARMRRPHPAQVQCCHQVAVIRFVPHANHTVQHARLEVVGQAGQLCRHGLCLQRRLRQGSAARGQDPAAWQQPAALTAEATQARYLAVQCIQLRAVQLLPLHVLQQLDCGLGRRCRILKAVYRGE